MLEAASRERNPYLSPRSPGRGPARSGRVGSRRVLWWGLLLAPYLVLLLVIGGVRLLYELGQTMTVEFRNTLITTSSLWLKGSVRAGFVFPSAWVLERVVHRLGSDSKRFRLLALQITVVAIYAFAIVELLEHFGYVSQASPLAGAMNVALGVGTVAAIPLLLVWATVAFRRRGRRRR